MLNKLSIRSKLALLAGVPVLGALALASLLWIHAQAGARSAAALGSVEDLADLSKGMADLSHELQKERALSLLVLGFEERRRDPFAALDGSGTPTDLEKHRANLKAQRLSTSQLATQLEGFLQHRNIAGLPPRLREYLRSSARRLASLEKMRTDIDKGGQSVDHFIDYFAATNDELIGATAALTQLTDDGHVLRGLSALANMMQVKERSSQEHALLAHVFALGRFPPGTYRTFVSLITEEEVYAKVLQANALDYVTAAYDAHLKTPQAQSALEFRKMAVENIDEEVQADANLWFQAKSAQLEALRSLETKLSSQVHQAARTELKKLESSREISLGVSVAVLLFSTLLAWLVAKGVAGSIAALSNTAAIVQRDEDFSVRAPRTTNDELGQLTSVFNDMLGAVQTRDRELEEYRKGLEQKVEERTRELRDRNVAMRLVLDNVDQGLATIHLDGTISAERSAAFDAWFGAPSATVHFADHLAKNDIRARDLLELTWAEVVEGFFPLELTMGQLPKRLVVKGRQYTLHYKPVASSSGDFEGALLIVSDVTEDEARRRREADQTERIGVFERLLQDRAGFIEFFTEAERLVRRIASQELSPVDLKRDIHTLKGNCGIYSAPSVATACHSVESALLEEGAEVSEVSIEPILSSWAKFTSKVKPLLGSGTEGEVVLQPEELSRLLDAARKRRPHESIAAELERLRHEPLSARFYRVGEQAKRLARKLGKPEPIVIAESNDVRLPLEKWRSFWAAFAHVVSNAIDHGLEAEDVRIRSGKPRYGQLRLVARATALRLEIEVHDDGRGIDWEAVRRAATARGLAGETQDDLVAALFTDSLSTKQEATETSGRGVGMAVVQRATSAMGGQIKVASSSETGTRITFTFPHKVPAPSAKEREVQEAG